MNSRDLYLKIGYRVVGGASKLFKQFITDDDPESIISYCDLRYFTGELYTNLGFIQTEVRSCYWYTKGAFR